MIDSLEEVAARARVAVATVLPPLRGLSHVSERTRARAGPAAVAAARLAIHHPINLGHRRIWTISGGETGADPEGAEPMLFTTLMDRPHGYQQVMEPAGLEVDSCSELPGHLTADGGARAAVELISVTPQSLFALQGEIAAHLFLVLRSVSYVQPHLPERHPRCHARQHRKPGESPEFGCAAPAPESAVRPALRCGENNSTKKVGENR